MTEPMPDLGGLSMAAILYRRLMYPHLQPVAQIVHEWYELARSRMHAEDLDKDAACVTLYAAVLPTVLGALQETGNDLGQEGALQELVACCLEAERDRTTWDSLPPERRSGLLQEAGMEVDTEETSPSANLVLWHMRTQQTVPDWYAQAQRSDA